MEVPILSALFTPSLPQLFAHFMNETGGCPWFRFLFELHWLSPWFCFGVNQTIPRNTMKLNYFNVLTCASVGYSFARGSGLLSYQTTSVPIAPFVPPGVFSIKLLKRYHGLSPSQHMSIGRPRLQTTPAHCLYEQTWSVPDSPVLYFS